MTSPELPSTDAEPVEAPQYRVRPRRRDGSAIDMVRSLGLVGLAVIGTVAFSLWNRPAHPPVSPDISATVQAARTNAGFPVLAMTVLPEGWYGNAARFASAPGTRDTPKYHLGYITQDEHYFGIDAEVGARPEVYNDQLVLRTETVASLAFKVYAGANGKGELWSHIDRNGAAYTITLTGTGTSEQWKQFTSALSADGAIAL